MLVYLVASALALAPPPAGQPLMNASYTVGNKRIVRTISIENRKLSTVNIGRPGNTARLLAGDEFAVIIGADRKRLTAIDFLVESVDPKDAKGPAPNLKVLLMNPGSGLQVEVKYSVKPDDFYIRKSLKFFNGGKKPVQILDVEVENLRFESAQALGIGKPVYAGDLFLGLEYPFGKNEQKDGIVTLLHHPGKTLNPEDRLTTKVAVIGTTAKGESVEEAFDHYVRRIALRKPEVITVYGNWALYDYLSDTVWPDEKLVLRTVDDLAKLKKAGWKPDYYLMDAGWYDTKGDYTDYVKPAWPDGPKRMVDAIQSLDIKYGLWFDVNGGIVNNPALEPSQTGVNGMCLASEPFYSTFKNALLKQIRDNGLRMVKFDFARFGCNNDKHGHLLGDYATEATITGFLNMLDSVRKQHPDVKYVIFNGFHRSPWWLMHIDTIYTNDPASSDTPALKLRDSINRQTDRYLHEHRFKHLLPWYAIDDCGLMIGPMGTIYGINAQEWRKTWVLNIGRGGMIPFIYGDLRLLDDSDNKFLVKIWNILRDNQKVFANTQAILGKPDGKEVYGYSHFAKSHGFVFMNNPTFEQKPVTLKLDSAIGLDSSAKSSLSISEIYPVECAYSSPGKSGYKYGDEVKIELAPFEVRALEIKAARGSEKAAVAPRMSARKSAAVPITIAEKQLEALSIEMQDMTKNALRRLVTTTTAKIEPVETFGAGLKEPIKSVAFSLDLPEFEGKQTLAIVVKFVKGESLNWYRDVTQRALVAAWSGDKQIELDITPEYGRILWSKCPWLTFHATIDQSLSGKKIDALALTCIADDVKLDVDKAYILSDE
ncbi:MAG: hypothetical protein Q7N50_02760 [Armatimonadota bacterium]|nr:hypothetical protein [Armatimonadota bacterium]